jgi:hypothetical protein
MRVDYPPSDSRQIPTGRAKYRGGLIMAPPRAQFLSYAIARRNRSFGSMKIAKVRGTGRFRPGLSRTYDCYAAVLSGDSESELPTLLEEKVIHGVGPVLIRNLVITSY